MQATIEVTEEDIEKGAPCEPTSCPIALSVRRFLGLGMLPWIAVGEENVEIDDTKIELPYSAQCFVSSLDCDGDAEPFSFTLDIPDEILAESPMTLPAPDPSGRIRLPGGDFIWESKSGRGWCACRQTNGGVIYDKKGVVIYFGSAAEAAVALGHEVDTDE